LESQLPLLVDKTSLVGEISKIRGLGTVISMLYFDLIVMAESMLSLFSQSSYLLFILEF
jgi:hypothetical protein